jgi:hypothetical protein
VDSVPDPLLLLYVTLSILVITSDGLLKAKVCMSTNRANVIVCTQLLYSVKTCGTHLAKLHLTNPI